MALTRSQRKKTNTRGQGIAKKKKSRAVNSTVSKRINAPKQKATKATTFSK